MVWFRATFNYSLKSDEPQEKPMVNTLEIAWVTPSLTGRQAPFQDKTTKSGGGGCIKAVTALITSQRIFIIVGQDMIPNGSDARPL